MVAHHLRKLHGTEQNNQRRPLISPPSAVVKYNIVNPAIRSPELTIRNLLSEAVFNHILKGGNIIF